MNCKENLWDNVPRTPSLKSNFSPGFGIPPKKFNEVIQLLGHPHIESFNYVIDQGLRKAVKDLDPNEFELPNGNRIRLKIEDAVLSAPVVGMRNSKIFPNECRQRGVTYRGRLTIKMLWFVDNVLQPPVEKILGDLPVMVKSHLCHLANMLPMDLVKKGEREDEFGGYFITKGLERLFRMLLVQKQNFPLAVSRSSWKSRGSKFSDKGVMIRCVREDQSTLTNVIHYLTDGTAKFMFAFRKEMFFLPAVMLLKVFADVSDQYIYDEIMQGHEESVQLSGFLTHMLRQLHEDGLHTHNQMKEYIGKKFRIKAIGLPAWKTDEEICEYLMRHCVLIHLSEPRDKFNLLVLMIQKLYLYSFGECALEGVDGVSMQEAILGGQFYLMLLKERLNAWMLSLRVAILKKAKLAPQMFKLTQNEMVLALKKTINLESLFQNFVSTGNLPNAAALGSLHDKGLTIVAENINRMRYMSHFRSIHRGSFFQEMRTSEVRQLQPDAWGFICPVHTPDGSPCGLLNHLTAWCEISPFLPQSHTAQLRSVLVDLGMIPIGDTSCLQRNYGKGASGARRTFYTTILNGCVVGRVLDDDIDLFVDRLRMLKIRNEKVTKFLEIALMPKINQKGSVFPALYLFTSPSRLMRPVVNLKARDIEYIGTTEQLFMNIAMSTDEVKIGVSTHVEIGKTAFLSNLALLIPMPDCNQSPRNMYQCQMGKQSMGQACHNWRKQTENKLFRLQTPGSPLFRTCHYDAIELDNYAMGINAVVAVISYTGYDMEDAMTLNKFSHERGFGHGLIYKSAIVDLKESCHNNNTASFFQRDPSKENLLEFLDADGLPYPGVRLESGDPYYCYFDAENSIFRTKKYDGSETAFVDDVKVFGSDLGTEIMNKVAITLRVQRNPIVGDKFASRAGQKGICSFLWPTENLPFTESGLVPDIVFNPHGFPSRMTMAMMIECMANKSAASHGIVHDATPFKFSEKEPAYKYFGDLLEKAGYNYYGTERMYSGVDGRELKADIFFGIVYYQRLRHMVSDKWQARSTGPIDIVTQQPIKGRRRGGGVRFGEMERDALISHGSAFLLKDRLLTCSDRTTINVCTKCGSIVSLLPITKVSPDSISAIRTTKHIPLKCATCNEDNTSSSFEAAHVFSYLIAELASLNIKVQINTKEV